MRLSARLFGRKVIFFLTQMKLIITRNVLHLASFVELENGLFKLAFHMVNGRVIQGHAHLEPKEGVVIVSLINFDH